MSLPDLPFSMQTKNCQVRNSWLMCKNCSFSDCKYASFMGVWLCLVTLRRAAVLLLLIYVLMIADELFADVLRYATLWLAWCGAVKRLKLSETSHDVHSQSPRRVSSVDAGERSSDKLPGLLRSTDVVTFVACVWLCNSCCYVLIDFLVNRQDLFPNTRHIKLLKCFEIYFFKLFSDTDKNQWSCRPVLAVLLTTKFPAVDEILAVDYHVGDRCHVCTYKCWCAPCGLRAVSK